MRALHRTVRLDSHTWIVLMRDKAWGEQLGRCLYCHKPIPRAEATADHVIPKSEGGGDAQENIAAACEPCNQAKRSLSKAAFVKALKHPPPLEYTTVNDNLVLDGFDIAVQAACRNINVATDRACKRIVASMA